MSWLDEFSHYFVEIGGNLFDPITIAALSVGLAVITIPFAAMLLIDSVLGRFRK